MVAQMKSFMADCKYLFHSGKTNGHHKVKRLKSHRERNQMRGYGAKSKSRHHHCHRLTSKDAAHFHKCCHSGCHGPSRRDVPFPNVVPASQELSIITDSRLIGHQGLFNHEVKSIDIERLLSEQRKQEKSGQEVQVKNSPTSHPSSTFQIPSPFCTNYGLVADSEVAMSFEQKAQPSTKDNVCEKEKKNSQGSELTPAQKPQQQLDLSSGSSKNTFSSKHSSLDAIIIKSADNKPVISVKGGELQQSSTVDRENLKTLKRNVKGHLSSTLENTPKIQQYSVHHTQAPGLSPSPLKLASSNAADSSDTHHRGPDPDCVSQSVSALVAGLCDCLQFPYLPKKNLVAESQGVILKALRERHGPQLQENLLQVQRCLSSGSDPTKEVQDEEPTVKDQDQFLLTDPFITAFTDSQPCFDTQKRTSFNIARSRHFYCKTSPQLHHSQRQMRPVETSVSLLDDILRPTHSPQFCMYSELIDKLFTPSSTPCWGEEVTSFQHWGHRLNRPQNKDEVILGSFVNRFKNQTRAVTERSSGSHSNIQPFFPYQAQKPDKHSVGQILCTREQGPFEFDKFSFSPSTSAKSHSQQNNYFQPLNPFSGPLNSPPLRSHQTDLMNYPPSHILERDSARSLSSFPNLEPWSFPPMRLY